MRARNIKPGFFKNEDLAECSPPARLLFIGLWMLADREGRLEYRPKRWKGELFPYENTDTQELFNELEAIGGLVIKYEVNGSHYVWIPHFLEHQKPHQNESPSTIPAYICDHGTKDLEPWGEVVDTKEQTDPAESLFSESLNPESGMRNPSYCASAQGAHDSGIPDSQQKHKLAPGQAIPEYSMEFLQIVELYPRKEGIEDAWITFKGLKASHAYPGNPIALPVLAQWAKSERWTEDGGKFVPALEKWLRGKRWQDQLPGHGALTPEERAAKEGEEIRQILANKRQYQ